MLSKKKKGKKNCPQTHEQIGVAYRKHPHIMEHGLILLSYPSMPFEYWEEAFSEHMSFS